MEDWKAFIQQVETEVEDEVRPYLVTMADIARDTVQMLTPIDTENLINSIIIEPVVKDGDTYTSIVTVDTVKAEYAQWVENGNGRSRLWHRNGQVFYVNIGGAKMFERSQKIMDNLMTNE